MEKKIFFSNMFPDYAPPDELNDVLAQAAIVAADIDVESGLHSPSAAANGEQGSDQPVWPAVCFGVCYPSRQ